MPGTTAWLLMAVWTVWISVAAALSTQTNRRVFVGSSPCATDLRLALESYGSIEDISVHSSSKTPFAFVTFADDASALAAIQSSALDVQLSNSPPSRSNSASLKNKKRSLDEWQIKWEACQCTNLVFQVHQSHADRLADLLSDHGSMRGILPTNSRTVCLLCFQANDPTALISWIEDLPFALVGCNKQYVVDRVVRGSVDEGTMQDALSMLSRDSVARLNVFPPKLLSTILELPPTADTVRIAPTGQTHEVSFVQVDHSEGPDGKGPILLMGTPQVSTHTNTRYDRRENDEICRAYAKLQEAFARCVIQPPRNAPKIVALDCGAAPGGWSKYLLDHFSNCRVVSVDPGELDASVRDSVDHMKMTIQEALPLLSTNGVAINVWVSDMCLHEMSSQIDCLLQANELGVLQGGAFFALTLKCTVGYSKSSYDGQVERQVSRLKAKARDVQTIHLFSNRSGERTVMGYLL
jgi:hypothetical protein